jgi:hypothetical protein
MIGMEQGHRNYGKPFHGGIVVNGNVMMHYPHFAPR